MAETTFLKSNTFKMYLVLLLLVFAGALNMYVTTTSLLVLLGWYAHKSFGASE